MEFKVLLFARARELLGRDSVTLSLPPGALVVEAKRQLSHEHPVLASIVSRSALAVAGEFAQDSDVLAEGAAIALIPPVSGGASA